MIRRSRRAFRLLAGIMVIFAALSTGYAVPSAAARPTDASPPLTIIHSKPVSQGNDGNTLPAGWITPIPARRTPVVPARNSGNAGMGSGCNAPCSPPLTPRGGAILHTPHVFLIYWGSKWIDQSLPSYPVNHRIFLLEGRLFRSLPGSGYNNILTQYYDSAGNVVNSKNTPILAGAAVEMTDPPSQITRTAEAAEITNAINANPGWGSTTDALFFLLPQQGSAYSDSNLTGGCAYHYVSNDGQKHVYALVPYLSDAPFTACVSVYGSGNLVSAMTVTSSHEYAEAVTDPWANKSSTVAWLDTQGANEIGDLCEPEHVYSPSLGVEVQNLFDNTGYAADPTQGCDSGSVRLVDTPFVPNSGGGAIIEAFGVVSTNDIWAVGSTNAQAPLIEHYNGAKWSIVPSPALDPDQGALFGIAVVSATDVWAVGIRNGNTYPLTYATLTEHWDGTAWSVIPSPDVTNFYSNQLNAIAALSPTDIWAVGESHSQVNGTLPLLEHWDGSAWTLWQNPPIPDAWQGWLNAAAVVPGTNQIWAVGSDVTSGSNNYQMLTEHWSGSAWIIVPAPNPSVSFNEAYGIAAVSPSNAWLVGETGQNGVTAIEHWNGSHWKIITSPNTGTGQTHALYAVSAVSAREIWAVGYMEYSTGVVAGLWEHWDGTSWSIFPGAHPDPNFSGDSLNAVAVLTTENIWAAGSCTDTCATGSRTLVERYT